jgi:hypothetical protein
MSKFGQSDPNVKWIVDSPERLAKPILSTYGAGM